MKRTGSLLLQYALILLVVGWDCHQQGWELGVTGTSCKRRKAIRKRVLKDGNAHVHVSEHRRNITRSKHLESVQECKNSV
eukprot:scaffold1752_cov267-Chaetoceros_neogracile.AAC.1